ncbi:unnamed protein product [Blepharisma stoltei]|uniref:Uncharacterized protein n=1 Tax=Blepharisma stoltei TaxID=1481888 RepID=A0AAU9JDR7_9CILI|nr:unnamed protein product [Blepharisma stoltei]
MEMEKSEKTIKPTALESVSMINSIEKALKLDIAQYQGEYVDGKKKGGGGSQWAGGRIYEGEFKDNGIHGVGIYMWSDGRKYVGEWIHSKMEGAGAFTRMTECYEKKHMLMIKNKSMECLSGIWKKIWRRLI